MTINVEQRRIMVKVLRENCAPDGTIPNRLVRPAADRLGVHPRSVRRWLAADVPIRAAFIPTDEHIDVLYAAVGNISAAYQICIEEGLLVSNEADPKDGICEQTFRRGFKQRVDTAIVHAAKHGWSGFVNSRAYGTKYAPHKGHTYASDSSPLNLLVLDKPGGEVIDLHETNLIDEFSRFALVVSTTNGHPDTETSIAVLAAGIGGYEADDGTQLGGIPDHVLSDNGGEYKSQPVTFGLVRLGFKMVAEEEPTGSGIKRRFSPPESGWVNGIDEHFHQTLQRGFSAKYPGYVNSDLTNFERLKQRDYWKDHPELLLTRDQVDALLQRWLMRYNFETPHSGIGGMTPFEKWKSDDRLLRLPDPETMRLAMLSDDTRIVDKGKVRAFSTAYYLPALGEHHGHEVEIRYLPGRTETIEIFYLDQHLGKALRKDLLDDNYHARLATTRDKQTEVHLGHSLSGERLKTQRVIRELRDLEFDDDQMPALPTEAQNAHKAPRRGRKTAAPVSTTEEQEALAAILPTHYNDTPDPYDPEEYIA